MEEIDLRDFWELIKSKVLLIINCTLIFAIAGLVFLAFINVPKYRSTTSIVLASNSGANNTITTSDVTINKNLVQTYSEIVKSRKVIEIAINNLGLNTTYEALVKNVSVSSVSNTEIIKISVSDVNGNTATRITNSIAEAFIGEVSSIYNMTNVKVLDAASTPSSPYNVNYIKTVGISIVAGIIFSLVIIFLIFYFDNTIKSPEQVETKTGLPVLGRIPLHKKGGKKDAR